jgi:hypothetical protein
VLKSVVKRLQEQSKKWWWHELSLAKVIGLHDTETETARELLSSIIDDASEASFCCEQQQYGGKETFLCAPSVQKEKKTVTCQPRYYLVGDVRLRDGSKMMMTNQNKLIRALQGKKKNAGKAEKDAMKRRQAGWLDWGERRDTANADAFEEHELPSIQAQFHELFDNSDCRQSVAGELHTLLLQSNQMEQTTTNTATNTTATTTATDNNDNNDDSNDDDVTPPPTKRSRVGHPRSITPDASENDPWLLDNLRALSKSNIQTFAEYELAVLSADPALGDHSCDAILWSFTFRNITSPSSLAVTVAALSSPKLASAKKNLAVARMELFASQFVKPQKDEFLINFFAQVKRLNEGERLPQAASKSFVAYKRCENGQPMHAV